ncbi:MAG: DNA polymerase III subunit [Candidatus Moranbacteria bacterium]|nr:DNA polymerase III subunit [Candidatus Moranbacteria bacterium]
MDIIGNAKTVKLLDRIIETGKIANAYLFLGPSRVGKSKAALEFSKKITGGKGKINPDLIIIEPETEEKKGVTRKLDIKVETIRELQHKLGLTSNGGKYKAVIIDGAERLNKTAQNALLKTLEEPNEKVVLILVVQNEKKILPTIVSRCQKIRFGLVSDAEIEKNILFGRKDAREMAFWSIGRPGIALELADDPTMLAYQQAAARELAEIFGKNLSERFSSAEAWSKDVAGLQKRFDIWLIVLRESMLGKNAKIRISPDKALRLIEEIAETTRIIKETNSNPRLAVENLFLKF